MKQKIPLSLDVFINQLNSITENNPVDVTQLIQAYHYTLHWARICPLSESEFDQVVHSFAQYVLPILKEKKYFQLIKDIGNKLKGILDKKGDVAIINQEDLVSFSQKEQTDVKEIKLILF
jgi:hypothetical protein